MASSAMVSGATGSIRRALSKLGVLSLPPLLALAATVAGAQTSPQVDLFSPTGSIREVRQVAVRFSAPMTALGDPRVEDPFIVACPASGHGSWADGRNWVYDFDADPLGGVACVFTLRDGLSTLDGTPLEGPREFRFDTGGPVLLASLPGAERWSRVDENQVFIVAANAPAMPESVRDNAYCAIADFAERIPVRVFEGAERDALLAQRRDLGYSYYSMLWADGPRSPQAERDRNVAQAEQALTVLSCARSFPPDTEVRLVWGAGVKAASGVATTAPQTLTFRTRAAFTAMLECDRATADSGCLPITPVRVRFSSPVPRALALAARIHGPDGIVIEPNQDATDDSPVVDRIEFSPSRIERGAFTLHLPADLRDDSGRTLDNGARFPLEFTTDAFPSLAKFAAVFGILEAAEGGVLPITLRNLNTPETPNAVPGRKLRVASDPAVIARWFEQLRRAANGDRILHDSDNAEAFVLPVPADARDAEVVGIPLGQPGFHVVELASPRLGAALNGKPSIQHVSAMALVTNLTVHFKWGRERSLIWVTRLDDGRPVEGAQVAITNQCTGATLWSGLSDAAGTAFIGPNVLAAPSGHGYCGRNSTNPIYLASARVGDDLGITLSTWDDGIEPYQFRLPVGSGAAAEVVHTVFDRPLFRAGELVSMKHYLRRKVLSGFEIAGDRRVLQVSIRHVGSDDAYHAEIEVGADGTAEQSWRIPENAKLGEYSVAIKGSPWDRESGRFKVQQFRVPTQRAVVQGPAEAQASPDTVTLDLHLSYLSGGSAPGVPVTLRLARTPARIDFADYGGYDFDDTKVTLGRMVTESGFDPEAAPESGNRRAQVMPLTLDQNGAARVEVPIGLVERPERLVAEFDYPDANGEILTATGRVELRPAALAIGIRNDGYRGTAERVRFRVVVLDLAGKPIARKQVTARLYSRQTYSYRKRLIGGFYGYESVVETTPLATTCAGRTDARGLLFCDVAPGVSGRVLIRAETADATGHAIGAASELWLVGADEWWFGATPDDRIDVIPERHEYESGKVARLQVRMPFRKATALITVEREGVLDRFVTELSGREPVVEIPIKPEYAPNVFISVLAVRGRIGDGQSRRADRARRDPARDEEEIHGGLPTAMIDLSKPAYRLGNAELRVGWAPNRLDVAVTPDKSVYRTREEMSVRIKATRADGSPVPAGAEVALAVVDEGLLELAPNPSWDLLDAMMGRRGIEVYTSTAQMQVVGKRHYGSKAVPHGGGGGRQQTRELFDTLLAWRGRVTLDAHGEATVVVPINDSLTSFRIVAVAHAGAALFGTGDVSVTTTQDLMLHAGLPPLVREGDEFDATFTVRNASDRAMNLTLTATAAELVEASLAPQRVSLEPGAARDVVWRVPVPVGLSRIAWEVSATADAGGASDRLKATQEVVPAYPVRVLLQATVARVDETSSVPLEMPADAIPGRGGVSVTLRSSLGDGLDGVRRYLGEYAYACLEQSLSKAVALRDAESWQRWIERLPAYMDGDGLLKYFPSARLPGEDILTSYVLAIADEAGWRIPDASRERLVTALTAFVEGRLQRHSPFATNDLAIRKLAAIEALSRYGAARPAMLDTFAIEPNLWPTSALLDWINILTRLSALTNRVERLDEAMRILRARFDFRGSIMTLSTERIDALWWLMVSTDANAARALLALLREPKWRDDVPRLVRGLLGRQRRGHWDTTVANVWGTLALERFSAAFETEPVTGTTRATYSGTAQATDWDANATAMTREFAWAKDPAPLVLEHQGTGNPWVLIRASAAVPLKEPLASGYRITKTVTPIAQRVPGRWTRGDLVRVHLDLDAQTDMSWAVVDDPIPAGATILGSGLGGQSQLATADQRRAGWTYRAFEERRADAFRAYYRFVPKGQWSIEYTMRLNNPGVFQLPATRVEAMYAPELFGELPNPPLTVDAQR